MSSNLAMPTSLKTALGSGATSPVVESPLDEVLESAAPVLDVVRSLVLELDPTSVVSASLLLLLLLPFDVDDVPSPTVLLWPDEPVLLLSLGVALSSPQASASDEATHLAHAVARRFDERRSMQLPL